ncbi:MAG: IS110 family transposase, partial [Conexivisphaera sp.]
HKSTFNAAVVDDDGNLLRETSGKCEPDELRRFSESLPTGSTVTIESSSTWYWAYRVLSQRHEVVLSNPAKTRAIASAKVKTDRVDAYTLADLSRGGYIAESYVPPPGIMGIRELVRYRATLVRMRTNVKNEIHSVLLMYNIQPRGTPFSEEYVEDLRRIGDYRIDGYLSVLDALDQEIEKVSRRIREEAIEDGDARLLMTIPGISYYSALLIAGEIGDISRFPDSDHLVSYAGLSPSTHSSGGRTYHGPITKQGSRYLRWILNQVTHANIRSEPDGTVARFYGKLRSKKGPQKAIVAASAKMLRMIYWVLRERRPYVPGQWQGPDHG